MIEKLQFISITGPVDSLDDLLKNHLSKYDINLTNAITELNSYKNLRPFPAVNKYKERLNAIEAFCERIPEKKRMGYKPKSHIFTSSKELIDFADEEIAYFDDKSNVLNQLSVDKKALEDKLSNIMYFQGLDFNIEEILKFKFIKFRFGKIPIDQYANYEKYVFKESKCLFCICQKTNEDIRGIYFCLKQDVDEVDSMFATLHFERYYMPDEFKGSPTAITKDLDSKIHNKNADIEREVKALNAHIDELYEKLLDAKALLTQYSTIYDAGQLAAINHDAIKPCYVICGWIVKKELNALLEEIKVIPDTKCVMGEDMNKELGTPPTKLNNAKIFKPFESLIKMYGLPIYSEMDPTAFVALSYSFIFGAMFGDVGQGAALIMLGLLLFFKKKLQIGAALSFAGCFSVIFGFMYGSVFGFEDIIHPIWLKPISAMTDLPILGRLNQVFVAAILFGISLIFLSMLFNMINCVRNGRTAELLTSHNAVPGLIFYGAAIWILISVMTHNRLMMPPKALMIVLFAVPLTIFMLKAPIACFIEKKPYVNNSGIGMFIVENFFEVFEILLSYFSNTLSFVRIGAFAVSHAAMMEVVMMLSGAASGNPSIIGVIIGNIFICAMEGLIVGIQVLRLEYYELFSRFYIGGGKEFKSFFIKDNLGGIRE